MRLIGGFLHLDGAPADPHHLDAMEAAMTEPGLNPRVIRHVDGPLALLTLDFHPSPAAAPASPEGAAGLVLAADLRMDGPEGVTDAASLARLLARDGVTGLNRLAGDFAFAAWDPQECRLTCARDGFGVRPLFIAHQPGRLFAFASLPCGLHSTGLVDRVLDEDAVIAHLLYHALPSPRSLFTGVTRLEPGSWLRVGMDGSTAQGHHWRLGPADVGWRRMKPADAAAELSALVTDAVRRRLPVTGPVAAHLSGGLDSSAICVLAARDLRQQGRKLLAYSRVPTPFGPYLFGGEGAYLAPVLRQEPDIDWQPVADTDPAAAILPRMDQDALLPIEASLSEQRILIEASSKGAQVLLSGWGGDYCVTYGVGPHGLLVEALLTGRWLYLAAELRRTGSVRAALGTLFHSLWLPSLYPSLRSLIRPTPPTAASLAPGLLRAGRGDGWLHQPDHPPLLAHRQRLWGIHASYPSLRAEGEAQLAARQGMAMAYPLLDRQVVEFALSLPSALFLREGWPRRLFRDAMAGVLPEELRWKKNKQDLSPVTAFHISTQRPLLLEKLEIWRGHPRIANLIDLDMMERMLQGLPSPEILARIFDEGPANLEEGMFIAQASLLQRTFRTGSYLAQWGAGHETDHIVRFTRT